MYGKFGVVLPIASAGLYGRKVPASFLLTLTAGTLNWVPPINGLSGSLNPLASANRYQYELVP